MPVPVVIADLSPIAANNFPAGSNAPSTLDDVQRAHGAFIAQLRDAIVPIGSIIAYDGLVSGIPSNWKLCDGTGGTPDLRDKFLIGSGTSYTQGSTGGSKDAVVVAHNHSATSSFTGAALPAHAHDVYDPGHTHGSTSGDSGSGGYLGSGNSNNLGSRTGINASATSIGIYGASAGTPSGTVSTSVASAGASGAGANLPPYYALMFIKRTS
jgi:microcystin-dependent protein